MVSLEIYIPRYNPNKSKLSYFLECSVLLLGFAFVIMLLVNWTLVIKNPESPNLMGSVIIGRGYPSWIAFFVCYIHPCYMILIMHLNLLTLACLMLFYGVLIVPFIILEFRVGRNPSSYYACHELRKPPLLWNAWRIVQIVQLKINDLLCPLLVPTQFFIGKMVVLIMYMLIKYGSTLPSHIRIMWILWATIGAIFWSLILLMGGYIHLYGSKILDSWKYHKWSNLTKFEKKAMSKFRKSCCPLSIAHGKTYVIKRLTVLKFIRGIIAGIFRALLTIGLKH